MTPEPSELGNTNGNGETIRRKKTNRHAREDVNGRRKRIEVEAICPCADANSSEGNVSVTSVKASSQVDSKKANARREMTMKDLCNNSDDMEDDEDDSDWDPLSEHGEVKKGPFTDANTSEGNKSVTETKGSPRADLKKASVGRELTMKDLCNNPDDLEDDEDDSDWEPLVPHRAVKSDPCADANTSERDMSVTSLKESTQADVKKATVERELTMKDLCNNPDDLEDDEDDNDWEPLLEQLAIKKWFCTNCTMLNLDGMDFCEACNEYKESGIVKHGFFASAILPGDEITHVESEVIERYTKSFSDISATGCSTVVGFDERMLLHSEAEMKSHPHPERPDRVRAIAASLSTAGIFPGKCRPIAAREITPEELQKVHSMKNIEAVELTRQMLSSYFTPDTYANEHSAQAARLAAGLCADLASEIFLGRAKNGFALVRPPGHHAGVDQSMGFCLHNNAAIAALAAQAAGAKKVLILDWDVHHGNGTQEVFEKNKSVLYISLHRHEGGNFYPGTGAAQEVGTMGAEGYCVNVPWSRGGVGDNDYIFAFQHAVLPIALDFAPDFVIISAGFDAARGDPLGGCDVTPAGYASMTHMLSSLAGGKLLVILEGGYNLRSISSSATEVIKVLLGESPDDRFDDVTPSPAGMRTLLDVLKIQTNFWPCLSSNFTKLQASWESYLSGKNKGKAKKRRRVFAPPIWWKWGRKRFLYHLYCRRLRMKA